MKKLYVAPDADIIRFIAEERVAYDEETSVIGNGVDFGGSWGSGWDGDWDA